MKRISRRGVLAALGVGVAGTVALTGCASLQAVGSQGTSSASAGGVTDMITSFFIYFFIFENNF